VPAPANASVTRASRPVAARQTISAVSGARCTPSRMIWTITSSRARAAPAMPGSRCRNGRIALKRCVTVRTPRSNAAPASSAVAVGVRLQQVDAAEAVHLEVDEAGRRDAAAVRGRQAERRQRAVVGELDVAGDELAADDRGLDAEPHGETALRMLPPASASLT